MSVIFQINTQTIIDRTASVFFSNSVFVFVVSVQSTKAVYDRIIDLRIATPQIIINYAMFLEEHIYFEESFKVIT